MGHGPHAAQTPETAFYRTTTANNDSLRAVAGAEGGLDAAQRATAAWKKRLAEYEAPPIDPGWKAGEIG